MRLFILFLLFSVSFAGEAGGGGDPKVQTTPEVQKILDARQKEIDTAALVYAQASIKANDKASKALEAVVKAKTQKGDLEGALAAKNILDQWKKESQEASNQILSGETDNDSKIIGKWTVTDKSGKKAEYTFKSGGTFTRWDGDFTWTFDGKVLSLKFSTSMVDTVTFDKNQVGSITSAVFGANSGTFVKVKEGGQ